MENEYDIAAGDYHWLYSDRTLTGEPFLERNQDLLSSLPASASALDCACGIGIHAIALARSGFDAAGSDASAAMVDVARERTRLAGVSLDLRVCRWEELPRTWDRRFDLVLCFGNAIGHCRDADDMVRSLRGMHDVLKEGGRVAVDSRNWEKLRRDRPEIMPLGPRVRDGIRGIPIYFWHIPEEWEAPHVVEVAFVFQDKGQINYRTHRVTYRPFLHDELLERLSAVGFVDVESDYAPTRDVYRVIGVKGTGRPA